MRNQAIIGNSWQRSTVEQTVRGGSGPDLPREILAGLALTTRMPSFPKSRRAGGFERVVGKQNRVLDIQPAESILGPTSDADDPVRHDDYLFEFKGHGIP